MFGLSGQNANPIFTLEVPGRSGVIGLSACPGIRLDSSRRGNLQRNLKRDLTAMQEWGATGVVTLNEADELDGLGLGDLGNHIIESGFWWRHLPIMDMNVPVPPFEDNWKVEGQQLVASLTAGERVVVHCLAGLGRTGMIAARLLVDMGMSAEQAIVEVRRLRPRAIQTTEQEDYVKKFAKKPVFSRNDRWSRLQGRQQATKQNPPAAGDLKGFGT
jgi:ADP-ribosyl-[dinitrogen reductase] hydrolase